MKMVIDSRKYAQVGQMMAIHATPTFNVLAAHVFSFVGLALCGKQFAMAGRVMGLFVTNINNAALNVLVVT